MKRSAVISALAAMMLFAPVFEAAAQRRRQEVRPGVARVELDSLVRYMAAKHGIPVYCVPDTTDHRSYTVYEEDGERFREEAFSQIRANGYKISTHRGKYIILYGKELVTSLPAGFWDIRSKEPEAAGVADIFGDMGQTATFQNKIYEIGDRGPRKNGKALVGGYVRDASTGEPLAGISVYDEKGSAYAQTDASGYYKIHLVPGSHVLNFAGYSLEDARYMLDVYDDGTFDITMKERVFALSGAVVTADNLARHRTAKMGIEKVRINTIKNVPAVFGEADVLKVVLSLPGVKSVGEVSNGFNVRGGSSDQNLILFNNGTIYNPSHLFGLISVFNPDVVSDLEIYKSSIPVEFGGRISSVLEVRTREGNGKKLKGSLGLGLLTSRLHLEGPLGSENTTFILGARATYSDWMLRIEPADWMLGLLPSATHYTNGSANFYDFNLGLTHRFNRDHSIHAYGYYARDKFSFSNDTTYRYDNMNVSLKWRSNFGEGHSLVAAAGYDKYQYRIEDSFNAAAASTFSTQIEQPFAKATFKSPLSSAHTLTYGAGATLMRVSPGNFLPLGDESLVESRRIPLEEGLEGALFASDEWQVSAPLSFDAGARYTLYRAPSGKIFHAPEARLSTKYSFTTHLSWKAGFNTMNQFIHKISNSINISPTDIWKLADEGVDPQSGWQAATGLYFTLPESQTDISVEGYYKSVRNFVDYIPGAILVMNENLAAELIPTRSKAYGVEWLLRRNVGKLNGWVSYTWSRSRQMDEGDGVRQPINRGEWYNTSYDKPHEVKVVANYKFTHRYSLSANLDYSTGRPVTIPIARYEYGGGTRLLYSDRNSYRIPDYFRLDLALNVEPGHYLKQLMHVSFTLGVYNVTGRRNAYSIYYTVEGNSVKGHMMSVFACQIPYMNLNLKF